MVASPSPIVAVPMVGASGTKAGVTELLALEALLVPIEFVAVIVNVYAVPFDNPSTVIGEPLLLPVNPPGLEVAVYVIMEEPPLLAGGVKVITARPLPRVAVPMVGASGIVAGTIELLVAELLLFPIALVATTVKVYVVPFVRPVTTNGDDPPFAVKPPGLEVTV